MIVSLSIITSSNLQAITPASQINPIEFLKQLAKKLQNVKPTGVVKTGAIRTCVGTTGTIRASVGTASMIRGKTGTTYTQMRFLDDHKKNNYGEGPKGNQHTRDYSWDKSGNAKTGNPYSNFYSNLGSNIPEFVKDFMKELYSPDNLISAYLQTNEDIEKYRLTMSLTNDMDSLSKREYHVFSIDSIEIDNANTIYYRILTQQKTLPLTLNVNQHLPNSPENPITKGVIDVFVDIEENDSDFIEERIPQDIK